MDEPWHLDQDKIGGVDYGLWTLGYGLYRNGGSQPATDFVGLHVERTEEVDL